MAAFHIVHDDLSSEATRALVALHQRGMRANSPPEHSFVLDLSGLRAPGITLWTAWSGARIAGMGALKQLSATHAEIKSMRTHPEFLRQGVGALVLEHILAEATARGLQRVSLETGTAPAFEAALALYRRRGFVAGEAFADYSASAFNQVFHLDLA